MAVGIHTSSNEAHYHLAPRRPPEEAQGSFGEDRSPGFCAHPQSDRGVPEEEVAGNGMHLTRELTEVVKAEVVSILKGYPAGLKAVQLYSMQWRSFPGRAPSLQEYMDLLRELQTDGTLRERHVPGKFRIWQLCDQREQT
jgi:hypothetical protein